MKVLDEKGVLMKSAFIYTPEYNRFDYGQTHPFKIIRLKLCHDLLASLGVFQKENVQLVKPVPATKEDILLFHDEGYIDTLMRINKDPDFQLSSQYGIGRGDNPPFHGIYDWSTLYTGASIKAAEMVRSGEVSVAFNIAGGLHHAMPARASGFCYINDPAIIIHILLKEGKKIAYIDIDAHHGDGVQYAFYSTNKVLTISLHESGEFLFPGTGFVEEIGEGEGKGFSVNLPFYPGTGDSVFLWGFEKIVPPLIEAYDPDILITQLGVDTMATDPLAHLMLTTEGFTKMVERFRSFHIPWIALGGGGYNIASVVRCWALAFCIMSDFLPLDNIPDNIHSKLQQYGYDGITIRDTPLIMEENPVAKKWVEEKVKFIEDSIFPIHGLQ